ncbi:MAG: tRNA (N6-isopentenyl adenosine(37)-C2)-methylthiotransferase MiaB [Fimbriimonadaceae bacterium]|nr:tRNA (N6-isopentenyl adenosine(37)-C2)-methylthiotransferase MiaB [Fimbriimonadaceae bacterium]
MIQPQSLRQRPHQRRGTYFVQTWGCQMNEEDSEQMSLYLKQIGFEATESIQEAHVILLNTCSVRKKPEDKAFSMLGELSAIKKARPDTVIGVCGCMAQLRADEIRRRAPHVDFVVGTGQVGAIPGLVEEALQKRKFQKRIELPERKGATVEEMPKRHVGRESKLKAFVPIQYGCDKFCTFCIVPNTRGRERSRPTVDILEEVAALASQGTREVTLLGQTVNSYGKNMPEGKVPFSQLLRLLSDIPDLERIRYTSPYPRDFKTDVIETIRDCSKVMEHCHMPVQAGSDELLKRMKRLYTVDGYKEIVRDLRDAIPGVGLTTDIIVGFPGETESEFQDTLALVQEVRFDGAYMFIYSPRPGTPAADMEQVPQVVKKERLDRLMSLQNRITCEINQSLVGQLFEVLVEGTSHRNPGTLQGYSREFRMVHFPGSATLRGQLVKVRAVEAHQWGLKGEIA